jgi:NADH-quinone oxidoreductase subunit L
MAFPLLPMQLATTFRGIYLFLLNKWYFDELYDAIFVQPMIRLSRILWQTGDATLIDGVPNGLAELAVDGSQQAVKIQTGSLALYAFTMLIGVVVLVGIFLVSR